MSEPATLRGKEYALEKLAERRDNQPEQIDNAELPAGSPMYYYCISCGHLADTKPENWYMVLPHKLCLECRALKELGWLE
jgi:hypothetical protein